MPVTRRIISYSDHVRARELATIGASQEDIAAQLRLPLPTVQRIFKYDLQEGAAHGRELALKKLHDVAISGDNATTLSFWVKSQCGWRDTGGPQGITGVVREVFFIGDSEEGNANPPV